VAQRGVAIGLHIPPKPPLYALRSIVYAARVMRLESLTVWDHLQDLFPQSLWTKDFTWLATQSPSPHEFFDFQVLLGYLASRAGRLRIGVSATNPAMRHPAVLAQAMLTLSHLTKRPPILGIGSGERENIEPYGAPAGQPAGRLEESVRVIRLLFDSHGPVDFEGRHFRLDHAVLDLQPRRRRRPDIWVAAHGPRMLRIAGAYGDGWVPVAIASPAEYAAKLAVVHDAARNAGRVPDSIYPALQVYAVIAPSEREARQMLDARPIRFVALLAPAALWRAFGLTHPLGDGFRGFVDFIPGEFDRRTLEDALAAVPRDALEQALVWGTPERVAGKLRAFGDAGARQVNIELASATVSRRAALYALRSLRSIARELRPA
jgi:phthiodiolone/phenolphthiodiolone dimycocerosates ketoreductase